MNSQHDNWPNHDIKSQPTQHDNPAGTTRIQPERNPYDGFVYLTVNDLYNINEQVTERLPYVRDRHLLRSAAQRPTMSLFGQPQFPTVYDKAAALLHSLAYHHLFADGNKRTAARALHLFLNANGLQLTSSEDAEYRFILSVAKGERDIEAIASWLQGHTQQQS
jgi:death on curing protein